MSSVALLFSDIEGSTRLLQRLGPSYASVLQEHHGILRHCFSAHDGREQGTEGDSFFVVFEVPRDAVAAALEAQRALARHRWPEGVDLRVRMGVHTGDVSTIGEGLVGMAIHEAARIMSVLAGLAAVAVERGDGDLAAMLLGAAGDDLTFGEVSPDAIRFFGSILDGVRAAAGDRYEERIAEGRALTLVEARDLATKLA